MTWAYHLSTSVDLRQLMYWMMRFWRRRLAAKLADAGIDPLRCCGSVVSPGDEYVSTWRSRAATGFTPVVCVCAGGSDWLDGLVSVALGGIGFIGLVTPIFRLCGLTDHRVLLPGCALAGASALLLADIVARLALAAAAPSVVTATLGAPALSGYC